MVMAFGRRRVTSSRSEAWEVVVTERQPQLLVEVKTQGNSAVPEDSLRFAPRTFWHGICCAF